MVGVTHFSYHSYTQIGKMGKFVNCILKLLLVKFSQKKHPNPKTVKKSF